MTGLEPAHLSVLEPKDTVTSLEQKFYLLTESILARITEVVK